MALSVKRFVAWGSVGAALIVAAGAGSLSTTGFHADSNYFDRPSIVPQATRARNTRQRLRPAIALLEVHDSIARALRARPSPPGISVVLPATASAAARRATDSIARDVWSRLVGNSQFGSTIILTLGDSTQNNAIGRFDGRRTFLPTGLDGRTCVVTVGLGQAGALNVAQRVPRQDSAYARSLEVGATTCAWFAKYGMPGPRIQKWLDEERWVPTWTATPSDTEPVRVRSRITGFRSLWWEGSVVPWFQRNGAPLVPSPEHLACLGGIDSRCAPSLRETGGGRSLQGLLPAHIPNVGFGWATPLHAALLSYLERELGRDKFRQFWTSPDEVEQALAAQGGVAVLQRSIWHDVEPYHVSPWPKGYEWPLLLGLLILPPGIVVLRSRRRFLAR